jgi:hypothetical protein
VAHGFKCVGGVSEEWQARDYELLTQAWRIAIRQRWADDLAAEGEPVLETIEEPTPDEMVPA